MKSERQIHQPFKPGNRDSNAASDAENAVVEFHQVLICLFCIAKYIFPKLAPKLEDNSRSKATNKATNAAISIGKY